MVVATEGVTFLAQEAWTLAQKAAWYEKIQLTRHNRDGLSAVCAMLAACSTQRDRSGPVRCVTAVAAAPHWRSIAARSFRFRAKDVAHDVLCCV